MPRRHALRLWKSSSSLLQRQARLAMAPVAGGVLHQLAQPDLGFGDLGDDAMILPRVIPDADLVHDTVDLEQGEALPAVAQVADHPDRVERIALEQLLGPPRVGLERTDRTAGCSRIFRR